MTPAAPQEPDCVVLLHGLGLRASAMLRLAGALRADGYRVVNLTYPSRKLPFEQLTAGFLPAQLEKHRVPAAPRLHFVTHSLGCLVVRGFIQAARPANLGRVVMIGPPNQGSAAADWAMRRAILRKFFGPNLARLGTDKNSLARSLPPADFEVGIIAGSERINALFDRSLGATHDGVVTVVSARLEGMRDFLVVPYSHTFMLWRRAVVDQTRAFLREGKFKHPLEPRL
jgi:triacylglycerol lipase